MFDFDASGYPPLPRLRGLFVTGTDTGVGKTLVAGAIARSLRHQHLRVAVFKPAASGCIRDRNGLRSSDAEFLAACSDTSQDLDRIAPVRYAAALAPNVAAEKEHRPVDLEEIFRAYAELESHGEVAVVEGIGGLMCPIREDFWVIHFARLVGLPVVIVARPGLGTINHTLLTLHAARSAGLQVAGVVVNRYPVEPEDPSRSRPEIVEIPDGEYAVQTNPRQIALRGRTKILSLVPDEPSNSVEEISIGPDTQYVVDQVDWASLMEAD